MDYPITAVSQLTAKMNPETNKWLPLWVHSADTYNIAKRLLSEWLSADACQALSGNLSRDDLLSVVECAAVLHDFGKATILFQTRITADCPVLQDRLRRAGVSLFTGDETKAFQAKRLSHAAAGEVLLLSAGCPLSFAEVIGAHHGQPWPEGEELISELQESTVWADTRANTLWGSKGQREKWRAIQKETLQWMLSFAGCDSLNNLPELSQPMAVLLSGLVIMADWIASNENYFPLLDLDETDPGDMSERAEKGWKAVSLPPPWRACTVSDPVYMCLSQFGFAPNGVQRAMAASLYDSNRPGLMILEAPMGVGKTEAALLSANCLSQYGAGGIFFGLPTQATANAIFDRVAQWGENQPDSNQISIRLAHGMADLNARYQALMAGTQTSSVEDDGSKERLVVHEWFRGRKQALLADFVVGTVDQVLMTALRQKHVMLRHLGICGKTVIIDECHAYDAYMNQYLEESLRWLGSYQTPVIMLSATLPASLRASFIAAYLNLSPACSKRLPEEGWYKSLAYPALTWTDGKKILHRALPYEGDTRMVNIIKTEHDISLKSQLQSVTEVLAAALKDGGCAAIILNTVKRAQYFAEALRQSFPDSTVLLLHSRFVMPDRLRHEEELLKKMGKHSQRDDRNRVIVVGTQVIEQSLDYDADVMISDLCPMDLLLQRLGRLHRHTIHDHMRPNGLRIPKCYILCAGTELDSGAKKVYGGYLLMRTRAFLPDAVSLPEDIPRLVNEVYDESIPLAEEPDEYEQARYEARQKEDVLIRGAKAFRIHHPDQDFGTLLTGSIPADDEHARAQVRAGKMTLDALLLTRLYDGTLSPLPWLRSGEAWHTDVCPSAEDCRNMLAHRIGLTAGLLASLQKNITWEELLNILSIPEAWKESSWLAGIHLLVLDDRLQASLGGLILKYSESGGLEWRKECEII